MVKALMIASMIAGVSAGGKLALTWEDCGDASTHGKTDSVEPTEIVIGQDTTITGAGSTNKEITSGTFEMDLTASLGIKKTYTGKICEPATFKMPLNIGTVSWAGMECPVAVGPSQVVLGVKMVSVLPAAFAKADLALTALDQDGEQAVCVNTHLQKESESFHEIVEAVKRSGATWEAAVPERFGSVDEVKDYLGAFLPGDEQYDEPEVIAMEASNALPSSFDSIEKWPQCSVISNVRDQANCGSCWAFGSVSSFESRACIETGKDIKYSPEDTAFCSTAGNGCSGGNSAWNWFTSSGVVTGGDYTDIGSEDTCYPYSLKPCAHHVPASAKYPACPGEQGSPRCARSCSESGYSKTYSADKVRAVSAYSIRGEENIMTELVNNGPIYVSFTVYSDFPTYRSGVYKHTTSSFLGGHAVTLVGYGELNGEKYWKIKNSWNEEWGNNGHFLIARGTNECGVESGMSAGKVSASTVV